MRTEGKSSDSKADFLSVLTNESHNEIDKLYVTFRNNDKVTHSSITGFIDDVHDFVAVDLRCNKLSMKFSPVMTLSATRHYVDCKACKVTHTSTVNWINCCHSSMRMYCMI